MHIDLPAASDVEALLAAVGRPCVSIYLPTRPDARDTETERIAWKNAVDEARHRLAERGVDKRAVAAMAEVLGEVEGDEAFWHHQANSLAVFVDEEGLRAFRLPNRLEATVEVSDRFLVKPLLRALTFPHAFFVLALAEGSVRLLEVGPDFGPYEVDVPDLPSDAAAHAGRASLSAGDLKGRDQSSGQKTAQRRYARAVDRAIRPVLRAHGLPLILAATDPIASIYRGVNTYDGLADEGLDLSPERTADGDLVAAARPLLDRIYAAQVAELHERFDERTGQRRTATEPSAVGRAASLGAVATLFVDIDDDLRGFVAIDGRVSVADDGHRVADDVARRVLASGGDVVAVRRPEVPGGGPMAAILRFPLPDPGAHPA